MAEWKALAYNLATSEIIWRTRREDGASIYRCRDRLFSELRDAVVESAEDGNALAEYMVIEMPWDEVGRYWVYDPKGVMVSKHEFERGAAERAALLQKARKTPSEDTVKRRRGAYWDDRNRWLEQRKRVLVEAEKERILSERRSAVQRKKIAPIIGSW